MTCENTGEPAAGLICGECADKNTHLSYWLQEVHDNDYSANCYVCGKNCGDYFNRKELAA